MCVSKRVSGQLFTWVAAFLGLTLCLLTPTNAMADCTKLSNGVVPLARFADNGAATVFTQSTDTATALAQGAIAYNTSDSTLYVCNGSAWVATASSSGAAGAAGPSFRVHKGGTDQTVTANTNTLVTWSDEEFDTNDNFASNRFTPTVAGIYTFTLNLACDGSDTECHARIFKNGSIKGLGVSYRTANPFNSMTVILEMNGATDYVEAYGLAGTGTTFRGTAQYTNFQGSMLAPLAEGTVDGTGLATAVPYWTSENALSYTGMYWDNTNARLGIGVSTPQRQIHLHDTDYAYLHFSTNTTGLASTDGADIGIGGDSIMYLINRENKGIILSTNGTQRMAISASGDVGIGTTSPAVPLQVHADNNAWPATSGTTQAGALMRLSRSGGFAFDIGANGASGAWLQATNSTNLSTGYPIILNPVAGDVGIGTTDTPGARLYVERAPAITANSATANLTTWSKLSLGEAFQYTGEQTAALSRVRITSAQTAVVTDAIGQASEVYTSSVATTGNAYGSINKVLNDGTGTVSYAIGVDSRVYNTGSGAITNGYGLYIRDVQATNDYGIYQSNSSDTNYFAGKIGIGTTTPNGSLDVVGSQNWYQYANNDNGAGGGFMKARGSISAPTAILENDRIMGLYALGYNGSAWSGNAAAIEMVAAEDFTTTANGTYIDFETTSAGSLVRTPKMRITSHGKVGIGTSTPEQMLHISGDNGIQIDSSSGWFLRLAAPTAPAGSRNWTILNNNNTGTLGFKPRDDSWGNTGDDKSIFFTHDGKVGIGTDEPSSTLDINGGLNVTGSANFTGSAYFGGTWLSISNWTTPNNDIDTLVPGSTFGNLIKGAGNGHMVFALRENGIDDGFYFLSGGGNYMTDSTYDTAILSLQAGGKVGIGTSSPVSTMEIYSGDTNSANGLVLSQGESLSGRLFFVNDTVSEGLSLVNSEGSFFFNTGAEPGSTSGTLIFRVNPDGSAMLTGALTQNSDIRLKKDVVELDGALDKVGQLRGVNFKWKDASKDQGKQLGVIAQEVQAIYPELVKEDENGILSVNYSGLAAPLIEAVKELKAQNENLQSQLETLAAEVEALKAAQ